MRDLVQQFVKSFQKAVRAEMTAMQDQMGPFEVPVATLAELETPSGNPYKLYDISLATSSDKLVLNGECTLAYDGGEQLATITAINRDRLTLRCVSNVPAGSSGLKLVIYPWFLYEKLLLALEALPTSADFQATSALTLFGKLAPRLHNSPDAAPCPELNASQQRAVQLCCDSNVSFVWGPPGSGKTKTLSHIVIELLAQGHRVLLTSTTNSAIDQALAVLATHPAAQHYMHVGQIVRVGPTNAETFGTSLGDVVNLQNITLQKKLARVKTRSSELSDQILACDKALQKLKGVIGGRQLDMFRSVQEDSLYASDLEGIFKHRLANRILSMPPNQKQAVIERRRTRLDRANNLCRATINRCLDGLSGKEKSAIDNARLVLATMTNMYISKLLNAEQFDVVIIEEAGMAVLPTLFYCAGMATRKVIAVGDPRQLPPIVVSKDPYAQKAMGRSIFEVTVPKPDQSPIVVMLDTQYRMHPAIGSLVSELFYAGKLKSADSTSQRSEIADKPPYPGEAVVVVDTHGTTRCAKSDGSYSRSNQQTAEICVRLASEAVAAGIESVAIITPYARQSRLISGLLADSAIPEGVVECRTVHRFQGNERDFVILDTVDALPATPGVLLAGRKGASSAPNLLNVSISRAKGKLVIVADVDYFHAKAPGSMIDLVLSAAVQKGVRVELGKEPT